MQCNFTGALTDLRFTWALFRIASSPFLVGGVHLSNWEEKEPEIGAKICRVLCRGPNFGIDHL